MKKLLFGILTFLGIGLSFCSANSCTQDMDLNNDWCYYNNGGYPCDSPVGRLGFSLYFNTVGNFNIDSISFYNPNGRNFGNNIVYVCSSPTQNGTLYEENLGNCFQTTFSLSGDWTNSSKYEIIFSSPVSFDSTNDKYLLFLFQNSYYDYFYLTYSPGFGRNFDYVLDNNISYKAISDNGYYLLPLNVCYSSASIPKFKVNYSSTSYEYTLEDNLFIHLKSPVNQNGNTFIYAGSTGINLYFNGSSQFYNKDKLFLNTPSWFNNNVFTPICL